MERLPDQELRELVDSFYLREDELIIAALKRIADEVRNPSLPEAA